MVSFYSFAGYDNFTSDKNVIQLAKMLSILSLVLLILMFRDSLFRQLFLFEKMIMHTGVCVCVGGRGAAMIILLYLYIIVLMN